MNILNYKKMADMFAFSVYLQNILFQHSSLKMNGLSLYQLLHKAGRPNRSWTNIYIFQLTVSWDVSVQAEAISLITYIHI